ncbi:unnamed protein product, partial [Symbiodinium microadriaticum]
FVPGLFATVSGGLEHSPVPQLRKRKVDPAVQKKREEAARKRAEAVKKAAAQKAALEAPSVGLAPSSGTGATKAEEAPKAKAAAKAKPKAKAKAAAKPKAAEEAPQAKAAAKPKAKAKATAKPKDLGSFARVPLPIGGDYSSFVVVDPPAASSVPQASDHHPPLPLASSPTRVLRASRVCEGPPSTSAPSYTSRRLLPVAPPFVPSSYSEPEYPLQGPVPEAPDSLPAVVPAQVLVLGRRLGSCENFSGEDRIRRAWKAGREAAEVLEGRKCRPEATPRLPLANRVYCILRVTDLVCPRVVHSFSEYKAFPGILSDPRSISHAFPSDSEARAFFAEASAVPSVMDFSALVPASAGSVELSELTWPPHPGEEGQRACVCYVMMLREDGFLLCLPAHFFEPGDLSAHGTGLGPVDFGPSHTIQASGVALTESGEWGPALPPASVPALLLDLPASASMLLSPLELDVFEGVFFVDDRPTLYPLASEALTLARQWVADDAEALASGYQTAVSELGPPAADPPCKTSSESKAPLRGTNRYADSCPHRGVLASAMMAQSRALLALVGHLAQGGDPVLDSQASSSSRGAQSRQRLQTELAQLSGAFAEKVRAKAARRMTPAGLNPTEPASLCRYFERYGGFSRMRETGLIVYQAARAFDLLTAEQPKAAADALGLLLVYLDQLALDSGSTTVAYLMTLLPDPPQGLYAEGPTLPGGSLQAFTPLADQSILGHICAGFSPRDGPHPQGGGKGRGKASKETAGSPSSPAFSERGRRGYDPKAAKGGKVGRTEGSSSCLNKVSSAGAASTDGSSRCPSSAFLADKACTDACDSGGPSPAFEGEFNFSAWAGALPHLVLKSRTAFSHFLFRTLHLQRDEALSVPTALYPLPLPDAFPARSKPRERSAAVGMFELLCTARRPPGAPHVAVFKRLSDDAYLPHSVAGAAGAKALFQGDASGVEFATAAHVAFLEDTSDLQPPEKGRIVAGQPPSRKGPWAGVIIDDAFAISVEEALATSLQDGENHASEGHGPSDPSTSEKMILKARAAYERAGILGSSEKDTLSEDVFVIGGAQVDSSPASVREGLVQVGTPIQKRLSLSLASLKLAGYRTTTEELTSMISGAWVSALLFRRCAMACLGKLFGISVKEAPGPEGSKLVPLPSAVRQELCIVSVLAPVLATNVAAPFLQEVFASDASMKRGAYVKAPASLPEASSLWLAADTKGFYTMLDPPARAALASVGAEPLDLVAGPPPASEPRHGKNTPLVPKPVGQLFDFLLNITAK